jgi:hypothetical protein
MSNLHQLILNGKYYKGSRVLGSRFGEQICPMPLHRGGANVQVLGNLLVG